MCVYGWAGGRRPRTYVRTQERSGRGLAGLAGVLCVYMAGQGDETTTTHVHTDINKGLRGLDTNGARE